MSIHADTIYDAASVSGATVYTVSDHASDAEAARTAENENQADAIAGVDGNDKTNGVSDILFDLTRQETRAYSHCLRAHVRQLLESRRTAEQNPERAAGFRVLKAPDVPSVLIELGYLSNAKDAASLVSTEWRDATSTRLAAAIDAFFAVRGSNLGAAAPRSPQRPGQRHSQRPPKTNNARSAVNARFAVAGGPRRAYILAAAPLRRRTPWARQIINTKAPHHVPA